MKKQTHISIALDAVQKALVAGTYKNLCLMVGDRPATKQEIAQNFVDATAHGYTVLPPCDNVDEKGHCMGHDTEDV